MKPWAIVAIVFGVLLVLAGTGVGIYFAVRSKPESSEKKPETHKKKPESSKTKPGSPEEKRESPEEKPESPEEKLIRTISKSLERQTPQDAGWNRRLEELEFAKKNGISAMFKKWDELDIGPRTCYETTGRIEGNNVSLSDAQRQCFAYNGLTKNLSMVKGRSCVGIRKHSKAQSKWVPCFTVWDKNTKNPDAVPETYIMENRLVHGMTDVKK